MSIVHTHLAGEEREGVRLPITVAGTPLRQEIYAMAAPRGVFVIILQDSLDDEGKETREAAELRQLLVDSLSLRR